MKKNPSRNTHLKKDPSKLLETINNSIDIDQRMYKEDIEGSIAHAQMLSKQKIITKNEEVKYHLESPKTVICLKNFFK